MCVVILYLNLDTYTLIISIEIVKILRYLPA